MRLLRTAGGIVVLALLILVVYLPGLDIQYYSDDYEWIDTSSSFLEHFTHVNPANSWYRPVQSSFLSLVQRHFQLNTVPIHLAAILTHAVLCYLVLAALMRIGYPFTYAVLAAVFLAVSQANALSLLSNDTLSQVFGTFFGCASLFALLIRRDAGPNRIARAGLYCISLAAFALALLSKESSVSFLLILVAAVVVQNSAPVLRNKFAGLAIFLKRAVIEAGPYAAVFVLYLATRWLLGAKRPVFGSDRYEFRIGLNLLKNFALDLLAMVIPTSTVSAFDAFHGRDALGLGVIAVLTSAFFLALAYGLWLRGWRDHRIAVTVVFLIASTFPMILLNHVSEGYVYNSMPFFAALVGVGIGTLMEHCRRGNRQALAAVVIVVLASHAVAIHGKALLMRQNGERATALVGEIGPYVQQVPRGGTLLLLNPPNHESGEYSVFRLNGFSSLQDGGEAYVKKTYGREDIDVRVVSPGDPALALSKPGVVFLGLEDDKLKPLAANGSGERREIYDHGNGR